MKSGIIRCPEYDEILYSSRHGIEVCNTRISILLILSLLPSTQPSVYILVRYFRL